MKKLLYIIIILLLAIIFGGIYYWYFYLQNPQVKKITPIEQQAFSPFEDSNSNTNQTNGSTNISGSTTSTESTTTIPEAKDIFTAPKLRKISETPISGMVASSSKDESVVRFIDRGTGHISDASSITSNIKRVSNTTLPKIYEAYGNRTGSAFIFRYLRDDTDQITNFYAELRKTTASSSNENPFELKGKYMSADIKQIAVSPKGDKVFTLNIESGRGIGYISNFDEKNKVKIIDNPINQANIDWPEINTLVFSTKASGSASGYIYTIDVKTGIMKTILGGLRGLTGKLSSDANKLIYSNKTNDNFSTSILDLKNNSKQDITFKTLSEKCVWSKLRKNEVYCAVPTNIPNGQYPDDWYKGKVQFNDQIWYLNTTTGEVQLIADLNKISKESIDVFNMIIDQNEDYLYFMNKKDLSLWSLDLNQ